jgi:hypothetical protein
MVIESASVMTLPGVAESWAGSNTSSRELGADSYKWRSLYRKPAYRALLHKMGGIMVTPISRVVVGISLFCAGGIVSAQEDSPWERFSIMPGVFLSTSDSELRFDSPAGVGTVLDPEDTLGIDSEETTYRIDGIWRFGSTRRHQLEVHYYSTDREGRRPLGQNTRIGDLLFPTGAAVDSQLQVEFINIDYAYAFVQDDRVRVAAAVGLHTTAFDFDVNAPALNLAESESFTAPLPVLGLRGDFVITPRWRFRASTDLMYLPIDAYDISVTDSLLAVEYLPFENVGFGLGVNHVRYRIASNSDSSVADLEGRARLGFLGALAYLKLRF